MVEVKTESQHPGEFIVSESNGTRSREVGTLTSGEVLVDGQAVDISSNKLIAAVDNAVGVVIGAHDATGADKKNVPYIARDAEVKDALCVYTDGSSAEDATAVKADLLALGIVRR